ncbi:RNA polymerase subunit sigma [Bacillus sp. FJAT-27225]|uniref:sigma-70 family RNA polymerase sigma factor n=1 Tax=Bacillus sp. FJAT-27225 TaxID=1743144 RepID=UPI00080C22AE|nr:sigma-70 family RNA polymerase sigma factor [Bacillus sp. FJAT-27225]OCA87529.1 RNA polymerase subunit sigma [Bacillus sp. FJAT-27225]
MELDEVYRVYVKDLYRYLFSLSKDHHAAEDLVQEAFYRAYIQLADEEISNIKAWLFKVAYHAFIDSTRKSKRLVITDKVGEVQESASMPISSPEKSILEKESFQLLLQDIDSLKEEEKHVILLCDLHKMSNQDAAAILGMKINTLKSHLYRGRKRIIARVKERRNLYEGQG